MSTLRASTALWPTEALARRPQTLVVATYNIHRAVGADGVCAPERVCDVLDELDADVIALQEVDSWLPEHGVDQLALFARTTGAVAVAGPTLRSRRGRYGNGLLSRWPIISLAHVDLSVAGCEPRAALDATIDVHGALLRVVATHLGLRWHERRVQARLLATHLDSTLPTVVLGDLNEWLPRGALRPLRTRTRASSPGATYPARWPILHLDRIFLTPKDALTDLRVHKSALACRASDHLPARAVIDLRHPSFDPIASVSR